MNYQPTTKMNEIGILPPNDKLRDGGPMTTESK
jgi:hypothetical protein